MGWFWSNSGSKVAVGAPVLHPQPQGNSSAPPSCPMHNASEPFAMAAARSADAVPSSCPIKQTADQQQQQPPAYSSSPPSLSPAPSPLSKLNPLNYMPTLSNTRAPQQTRSLPTEREISSIPRGDSEANWEYPSPQQMYHALLRKGGIDDEQASAVESMVAVHNFLNEGAWSEIRGWEKRFAGGLARGWDECLMGERRWAEADARREANVGAVSGGPAAEPKLLRFMGRPREMSPKATALQWLGWAWPERYGSEAPFDRHDWFVQRQIPGGKTKEVRYVIDYYSGPPEPTGEPVFYLDVRPALDTPTAAVERLMRWGGDVWHRASGTSVQA